MKSGAPADRPQADKVCVTCGRTFAWRRKWVRCWEQVKFCSRACRRGVGRSDFRPR